MAEVRQVRGILDTSVIIGLEKIDRAKLPIDIAVSAITMAELAAAPHATTDVDECAVDLLVAATACTLGLPLFTRNPEDFTELGKLVEIVPV